MKYLVMCEGGNEVAIMNILLENDLLIFKRDDLLGLSMYHSRQINATPQVQMALRQYPGQVTVYRIGDTLSDELIIPDDYIDQIICVEKYCTKPELERLVIIAADLERKYQKTKSKIHPKAFAKKEKVEINGHVYKNSSSFYEAAFSNDVALLVNAIKEYRRISDNSASEKYLAELLKDE